MLCYNTPDCHPFITDEEKKYLQNELGQQQRCEQQEQIQRRQRHQDRAYQPSLFVNESKQKKELKRTPWRQILTSVPFIALILCQVRCVQKTPNQCEQKRNGNRKACVFLSFIAPYFSIFRFRCVQYSNMTFAPTQVNYAS